MLLAGHPCRVSSSAREGSAWVEGERGWLCPHKLPSGTRGQEGSAGPLKGDGRAQPPEGAGGGNGFS